MAKKFKEYKYCKRCRSTGRIINGDSFDTYWESDCYDCKGTGFIEVTYVVVKEKKKKKKKKK